MGTQKWGTHPYGRMESNRQMDNAIPHRTNQNKIHQLNEKFNPQPESKGGGVRCITGIRIVLQFFVYLIYGNL